MTALIIAGLAVLIGWPALTAYLGRYSERDHRRAYLRHHQRQRR